MTSYARLLGVPQFRLGETWHDPPFNKARALLFYLVYKQDWINRDELLYLFYPDSAEQPARANLRQLLTSLRRLPYSGGLETEDTRLCWQIETDVASFNKAISEEKWSKALELYRGELLHGFQPQNLTEFDNWLSLERQALHSSWRKASLKFADELATTERYALAAQVLASLHKADFLNEEILRAYLETLYRGKQKTEALEIFATFRNTLHYELSSEPEGRTLELIALIQQDKPLSTTGSVAVKTRVTEPQKIGHNLPNQVTEFVGREIEKTKLAALLAEKVCRLVTIVAPGGMGKTRLALEVARTQTDQFENGVWFVSFVAVNAPEQMIYTIADALGIKFFGQREPKEQLVDQLAEKELLLILDNLEHLLSGVGLIRELLGALPKLKILATSRERLNLQAEHIFDLEGLAVPDEKNLYTQEFDALKLFAQSAKQSRHEFVLDENSIPSVTRICTLVAGMPLAIEIAASWLRVLSITDIASEIEKGIGLLESSSRDLPARHHNIRTVFDHSWKLLTQDEQTALRRLSIFQGGFRREAALEIAEASLLVLASLVDKSFLSLMVTGRYSQHPLVIQYTREKLAEDPEEKAQMEEKHGLYYLHLFQNPSQVIPSLVGATPRKIQEAIKPDFANFRIAWAWGVREVRVNELRKILSNLIVGTFQEALELWEIAIDGLDASNSSHHSALGCALIEKGGCQSKLGYFQEGQHTIERGLDIVYKTNDIEAIVTGLAMLSDNAWMTGDYDKSKAFADKGLSLARQHGYTLGIRGLLVQLANVIRDLDDSYNKDRFYLEVLAEMRQIEDGELAVFLHIYSFFLVHKGDLDKAQELAAENLKFVQHTETTTTMESFILDCMGLIAYKRRDYGKAQKFFMEALALPEEDKATFFRSGLRANLGKVATTLGDYAQACTYLRESFEIGLRNESLFNLAATLVPLAELAMAEGQPQQAAEWLSLSLHHKATQWHERKEAKRLLDIIKPQLSAKVFKAALERGKQLDLTKVVQGILEEL